jgi:hypothetical protein
MYKPPAEAGGFLLPQKITRKKSLEGNLSHSLNFEVFAFLLRRIPLS